MNGNGINFHSPADHSPALWKLARLTGSLAASNVSAMTRIRSIVTIALLALWLPLMVHCQLETIPGLEFLQCASDSSQQTDCDGDSCCAVEKSHYKAEENSLTLSLPEVLFTPCLPVLATITTLPERGDVPTTAPPELPRCWQFVFRTASPPRAPSFAS
jgi:hypothetical protein